MKGIILAGGTGTRLYPLTRAVSKQLLPVYDKPMIYYPLSVLMLAGIRDILVITTPEDQGHYQALLDDGRQWGIALDLRGAAQAGRAGAGLPHRRALPRRRAVLPRPRRQRLFRARPVSEVLARAARLERGATVFGYRVSDPERYGVVSFDADGKVLAHRGEAAQAAIELGRDRALFLRRQAWSTSPGHCAPRRAASSRSPISTDIYLARGELKVEQLGRGIGLARYRDA